MEDSVSWFANGENVPQQRCKVRVTDARELTAEKAVQRVLQWARDCIVPTDAELDEMAESAGMSATIKNGKVIVRKAGAK